MMTRFDITASTTAADSTAFKSQRDAEKVYQSNQEVLHHYQHAKKQLNL